MLIRGHVGGRSCFISPTFLLFALPQKGPHIFGLIVFCLAVLGVDTHGGAVGTLYRLGSEVNLAVTIDLL